MICLISRGLKPWCSSSRAKPVGFLVTLPAPPEPRLSEDVRATLPRLERKKRVNAQRHFDYHDYLSLKTVLHQIISLFEDVLMLSLAEVA